MLLVEHDVGLVLSICDRVEALDFGRSIASGTPAEIAVDDAVHHRLPRRRNSVHVVGAAATDDPSAGRDVEATAPLLEAVGLYAGFGGVSVRARPFVGGASQARSWCCSAPTARASRRRCARWRAPSPRSTARCGGRARPPTRRCIAEPAGASASSPRSARSSWASRPKRTFGSGAGRPRGPLDLFPELRPLVKRRAGLLSGGEQQILTPCPRARDRAEGTPCRRALARPRAARRQPPARCRPRRGRPRRGRAARRTARRAGAGDRRSRLRAAPRPRVVLQGTAAELSRDFDELRNSYLDRRAVAIARGGRAIQRLLMLLVTEAPHALEGVAARPRGGAPRDRGVGRGEAAPRRPPRRRSARGRSRRRDEGDPAASRPRRADRRRRRRRATARRGGGPDRRAR